MKSQVYWNLHKQVWSVRRGGRVVSHRPQLWMTDVDFRVQQAGRLRVIEEKRKNVHAYANGNVVGKYDFYVPGRKIIYNPYKFTTFVYADDLTPVFHVDRVFFDNRRNVWELV